MNRAKRVCVARIVRRGCAGTPEDSLRLSSGVCVMGDTAVDESAGSHCCEARS